MPDPMRASAIALVNHYQIARQQLRSYSILRAGAIRIAGACNLLYDDDNIESHPAQYVPCLSRAERHSSVTRCSLFSSSLHSSDWFTQRAARQHFNQNHIALVTILRSRLRTIAAFARYAAAPPTQVS